MKKVTQHIPTMTNSHHGGFLSVMIMVGICQWQNPTIDEDDEELQLFNQLIQFNWSQVYFQIFNHLTQFNWSQVYFAINRSVWVNFGRKYVCLTQLTVLTFHKLSFDISEVKVTEVMCRPRAICFFSDNFHLDICNPQKFILICSNSNIKKISLRWTLMCWHTAPQVSKKGNGY